MYKTKAIRFEQNGRVFYSAVIPAGKLIEMTKVDVWDADNPYSGYQRAPSEYRKREIGRYAKEKDSIMPQGGLLNARAKDTEESAYGHLLKFEVEEAEGEIKSGTLTIPDEVKPLYIVDMQHRLGGYEWAIREGDAPYLSNFPLVVTIADGLSLSEELDQFDLINTTQKKVRTDLARRLKAIQAKDIEHKMSLDQQGRLWEAKGPVITAVLNQKPGVWQGRILPPNKTKKQQPTMITKETSFVTSLKPILQTPFFVRQQEEHSASLIGNYWEAVRKVFPRAFEEPNKYVIQKTPGIFSLHEIAPEVIELARDEGEITIDSMYIILKNLESFGDEYWEADNYDGAAQYGSMKGFKILASELRQQLPLIKL